MQTNSRNGKRIFASSGSFWGADAPATNTDHDDEKSTWYRSAEEAAVTEEPSTEMADAEAPATVESAATEVHDVETPAVTEAPDAMDAHTSEDAPTAEEECVTEEPVAEVVPAVGDVPTADGTPEANDAPEPDVIPAENSDPIPHKGPIPAFLDVDVITTHETDSEDSSPRPTTPAQDVETAQTVTVESPQDNSTPARSPRAKSPKSTQKTTPKAKAKAKADSKQKPKSAQHTPNPAATPDDKPLSPSQDATTAEGESDTAPNEGSSLARTARNLWTNHRVPTIIGISLIVILIITYIAGGVFFSSHFLPRTTVNGNDASLLSSKDFANQITQEANGYSAHVTGDGIDLTVNGADVALTLDANAYVKAATSQVPSWLWPFAIVSAQDYEVNEGVSLDEDKLGKLLAPAIETINEDSTPTTNANISYDEDTHNFLTVPEKLGTELDSSLVLDKVSTEMCGLNTTITLGDTELVQPTVTAEDPRFAKAIDQAEHYPDLKLKLVMGGEAVKTLDADFIRSWLALDDDFSITGNEDAVAYYTRGTLSSELDSVSGYRTYTRPDGKTIQINDGTYGWNIDGGALAKLIVERIHEQSAKPIEVPCITSAVVYNPGGPDWGNRYIDVDLTEQYARMYDENGDLIWSSECVSGGPSEGNDTVTGVFAIEDKVSPMTLIGLDSDGDGEPDYENEVTYWMPFWGGYGLHDATWRYTFGGEEYLYDGSHGCVNLPYDAAEQLYYSAEVGDAVIVHW